MDLEWLQLKQLCDLTGKAKETAKKKCRSVRTRPGTFGPEYFAKDALKAIYLTETEGLASVASTGEVFDAQREKARLDARRAEKVELEIALLKGELVRESVVAERLSQALTVLKVNLRGIPVEMAPQLARLKDERQIAAFLEAKIDACLLELSSLRLDTKPSVDSEDYDDEPS